jgi:biotin carboxyl carrier protein
MRHFTFIHRGLAGPEELSIQVEGSRYLLSRGGKTQGASVVRLPDGRLSLLLDDGQQICGRVIRGSEGIVEVVTGSSRRKMALAEPLRDRIAHAFESDEGSLADEEIRALIPGRVVEVHVVRGQRLEAGALVLVLEAMKMQNEIRASRGGTVTQIYVEAGKAVEGGSLLAVVHSEGA